MHPPPSTHSSLRCPLNDVFGTRGQVRLLRVLANETRKPLHPSEVASRAGMTESGARRGLQRLARTGLVERVRDERGRGFLFCRESPLARQVARLFIVERSRCEALARALRETVQGLPESPKRAWVQEFLDGWSDCQELVVSWEGEVPDAWVEELAGRLDAMEKAFDVTLELRVVSGEEMTRVDWSQALMLVGSPPGVEPSGSPDDVPGEIPFSDNGRLSPESPEFSGALVALLEENLSVIRRARESVRGRLNEQPNGHTQDLWEWQKILDTFSFPRLLHFLGSDSPRAVRLRECSPFPAVLSEEEKARLEELATRMVH